MPAPLRQRDPDPAADRRGCLRHPVQMEGVLSVAATAAPVAVTVIDISEYGCQIVRPEALTRDMSVLLSFGGFSPFEGRVMWTSPRAAGLRFDHPVHPALIAEVVAAGSGRKRARRTLSPGLVRREEREKVWHLRLDVAFEDATVPQAERRGIAGTLSDLSVDGCRIACVVAVLPGTSLLIHLGDRAPMLGIVRWCRDGAIGMEFGAPLPPGTVERIARAAG